jgi:hypothetical protein
MKTLLYISFLWLVLAACQPTKNEVKNPTNNSSKDTPKQVVGNASAAFMVEGMVCKMGCGGAIRKDLMHSGSVAKVNIDFKEDATSQLIVAEFDSTKIDMAQMKSLIERTNEGQFKVLSSNRLR